MNHEFTNEEIKRYVRSELDRRKRLREASDDELAHAAFYLSANLPVNLVSRYLAWQPGEAIPVPNLIFFPGMPPQHVPQMMIDTTNRHQNWHKTIDREFALGQVFVAVGLVHIQGAEDSILEKLKAQGFEIKSVPCEVDLR